jgi:hypothetical protein
MGKRSRVKARDRAGTPGKVHRTRVLRPFAGLRSEADIIAMREIVPSATARLRLVDSVGSDRDVLLCTLLPMAAPALVRQDGTVWLGLQVQHAFGDPSRELAAVLLDALGAEPGEMVGLTEDPGEGPRLQDLVVDEPLEVAVHDGFDFWISDLGDEASDAAASLEQANAAVSPTARLTSVEAAYWTDVGSKEHLRWVLGDDEDTALTALARLHAGGKDELVAGSRLVGMFRAQGLLVPVWDLPVGTGPEALEEPVDAVATALREALQDTSALSSAERSARAGLANRQVTIR